MTKRDVQPNLLAWLESRCDRGSLVAFEVQGDGAGDGQSTLLGQWP